MLDMMLSHDWGLEFRTFTLLFLYLQSGSHNYLQKWGDVFHFAGRKPTLTKGDELAQDLTAGGCGSRRWNVTKLGVLVYNRKKPSSSTHS